MNKTATVPEFHAATLEDIVRRSDWDALDSSVEESRYYTARVLALLLQSAFDEQDSLRKELARERGRRRDPFAALRRLR